MVQVLPGFAPQLGENIASIIGSIGNIIDPDYEVKKMIKQKAMADPSYAQTLANFAYSNPDVFKQMGLGKVADVIGDISPDLKTVMQEAQKGFVKQEAANPNAALQKNAAQSALYGKTEVELEHEQLRNTEAGLNIALAKQRGRLNDQQIKEGEAQLKQIELSMKGVEDAIANYPALKGMRLGELAKGILDGTADSGILSQIYSTPQLREPMQQLLEFERQKRSLSNQLRVASYSAGLREKDIDNDMWVRSGGIGNPALWQKYRTDPATQQKLFGLIANPKEAKTPEDQMLLQMYDAISGKQNAAKAKIIKDATAASFRALAEANQKGADKGALVSQLNVIYKQLGEQTGDYYQAVLGESQGPPVKGWFRDKPGATFSNIKIVDALTGKQVNPAEIATRASGAPTLPAPETKRTFEGVNTDKVKKAVDAIFNAGISGNDEKLKAIMGSSKLSLNEKKSVAVEFGIDPDLIK